jgi:hypothetical protein
MEVVVHFHKAPADHQNPPKNLDKNLEKFHRSLGAIKSAADKAKDSPQGELGTDSFALSPSVTIRGDL